MYRVNGTGPFFDYRLFTAPKNLLLPDSITRTMKNGEYATGTFQGYRLDSRTKAIVLIGISNTQDALSSLMGELIGRVMTSGAEADYDDKDLGEEIRETIEKNFS